MPSESGRRQLKGEYCNRFGLNLFRCYFTARNLFKCANGFLFE
ncbi:hypothetical protein NEICINOT_03660 [Neisseria cinerea ATCC 14685]|uniref:Uncharacterized protein n=1 Tax=Neisseria cinerea ATCC 14685 TaxID=546262 RepID=D0W1Y2_NEICI|nr:hypothetical protein NEICINOT_03660 [Neisseria cinerea ATCC 14685]